MIRTAIDSDSIDLLYSETNYYILLKLEFF